jgi:type II secretory pathway component PulM
MNFWNQLRPLEKRLVVGVGAAVFIVLNAWFVVPHFSDWGKVEQRNQNARKKLEVYNNTLARTNELGREIRILEDQGAEVPLEDQMTHFASTIQSQEVRSGVDQQSSGKVQSTTNQNFVELSQNVQVSAKEQQLVDFLYNLGASNSLIRVRDMTLHPDQPQQRLIASIRFVGSYQLKSPARSAAPASTRTTGAPTRTTPAPANSAQKKATPPANTTLQPKPAANPLATQQKATQTKPPPAMSNPPAGGPRSAPGTLPRQGPPFVKPGLTNKTATTSKQ